MHGEFLTKLTVWLALTAAMAGALKPACARMAWTAGGALLLAHIACAYQFYHHWSHRAAYIETARQTQALTGLAWGGGLYINYLLAAAWMAEIAWWWLAPDSYTRRPQCITWSWRGFYLFMAFNGAVVFVSGPLRWLGLLLCLGTGYGWWRECATAR